MNKHFFNTIAFLIFTFCSFGQKEIHISILESNTLKVVSFVKISTQNDSFFTGVSGAIELSTVTSDSLISFECHPYLSQSIKIDTITDSLIIKFVSKKIEGLNENQKETDDIINLISNRKSKNDPLSYAPFYYTTYNKFYIETDQINEAKHFIDKFIHSFSLKLKDFEGDHFILLTESTTERRFINFIHDDETVTASKVSGIKKPLLLTMNSQLLPYSFYEDYIHIGNKKYTNPLARNPLKRYNFNCIDTTNEVYTIIFNPKTSARFEGLQGTLFIDANTMAITKAVYTPSKEAKNLKLTLVAEFKQNKNGLYLPYQVKTLANIENVGSNHVNFLASASTVYSSISLDTTFNKASFDEYAIRYNPDTTTIPKDNYWKEHRKLPFSQLDSNTYAFYDTVGNIKNFENLVYAGERIVFKKIPYKFLDFDLKRVLGLNEFEGIRLGIGAETNERLFKHVRFGAYIGRGLKDRLTKYGLHTKYLFLNDIESTFKVSYSDDVHESGGHSYYMDKYQHSSEWLRKLKIGVMEKVQRISLEYSFRPVKFLYLRFGVHQSSNTIYGSYRYIDNNKVNYNYSEIRSSIHYQFGQRYLKLLNDKYPFEQRYPHVWVE